MSSLMANSIPLQDASSRTMSASKWPDPLAPEAMHGLVGELIRTVEPHTEADPAAVLIQTLVAFSNAVGPSPHFIAEADRHALNLFAVFVGETAKGRKGTSWGYSKRVVLSADPEWTDCLASGLSSGEGLIWQVRDPIEKQEAVKEKGHIVGYQTVIVDEGIADKRLMVIEGEFASPLRVMGRDGNTLSAIIRNAWDSGNLRSMTKNSPAKATGAHISIIGHITKDELSRYMNNTEAGNGFANRILWNAVKRSKVLPEGGNLRDEKLDPLIRRVADSIQFGRTVGEMRRDDLARKIWCEVYADLSEGKPGLLGAMIARAEAQVMRLACIYALLDQSRIIGRDHLLAGLAVWEYCEASARYIFGEKLGGPVADDILRRLRQSPGGQTRTDLRDLFQRNKDANRIGQALDALHGQGLARSNMETTDGRPAERWFAT